MSEEEKPDPKSYHELEKLTVGKLRELAAEYEDLTGVTGMHKETLVDTLAKKRGIEIPHKVVVGVDKAGLKTQIRELKKIRDQHLEARDHEQLRRTRRKIHRLRRQLRRSMKVTA